MKNKIKRREENDPYLTHVCRYRRSRQITMKTDENGAFTWWKPQCWLKAPVSSILIVICLLRRYLQLWVKWVSLSSLHFNFFYQCLISNELYGIMIETGWTLYCKDGVKKVTDPIHSYLKLRFPISSSQCPSTSL